MPTIVRYGVLGAASIARTEHLPAAQVSSNSRVVAIGSRDKRRAEQLAGEFGMTKAYGSYHEMLTDSELDAVINALPNSLHCEWSIKAAEAGKHVLCEKPFAVTVEEARRMIDAAAANGVLIMEAFTHRFTPALKRMRELLATDRIGTPLAARAVLTFTLQDWQRDSRVQKDLAGGALLDAGCYCVSALRFVLNAEPIRACGWRRIRMPNEVDSTFAGELQFPGGCTGSILTSQEAPVALTLEVVGTHGIIRTPDFFRSTELSIRTLRDTEEARFEPTNRFQIQIEHFSNCILGREQLAFPPEDALRNTAALVALKLAAERNAIIPIS